MKKKVLCIALSMVLVFALAACGGSSQEAEEADVPKSEETATAGSNIPLKDNQEEAEAQIKAVLQSMFEETYGDKIDDSKINVEKIYTAEDEQEVDALKQAELGLDAVAFEVSYDLHPAEGADVNELLIPNGELDEESGWVVDKKNIGILRLQEDGTYTITDFGTGW